jgi:cytidylate kinase
VLRQIIALDGPAGAGKSTVGVRLAARLGWLFVDTGVFYRVLTHEALQHGVSPSDEPALVDLARGLRIRLVDQSSEGGSGLAVWVDGSEVTAALRTPAVEGVVSPVAALPRVRAALMEPQRAAVGEHAAVVAGRDIGTVIFPDAGLKVYLDASPSERARRRRAQLAAAGESISSQRVLEDLERRDRRDSTRAEAPLAVAADAVSLCTDGLSADDVVVRILDLWSARAQSAG